MYQKTILDNRLRVVTATMPHTQSVSLNIFVGAGSRYEEEGQAGICHFIEHMCFRGTTKRPSSRDVSTAIEGVGGIINGGTDKELTVYWCKVPRPHFTGSLDVLVDMLLDPRLDPKDMENERQVIIEEINMCNDSPAQRVEMLIDRLLWPEHPLGRDTAGKRESVAVMGRDDLVNYMKGHYLPANSVIAVAGNVRHDLVVAAAEKMLGNWEDKQVSPGYLPYVAKPVKQVEIETRETEQVHLCLAMPGLSIIHPQRFALDLLNVILGEGMSSRLFTEVRDKLGLAYSINSYVDHFLDTGAMVISAGTELKNLSALVKATLEQLGRLGTQVPEDEIAKAKEFAKGRLLLRMEESRNVASWIGGQEILTGHILTVDEVVSTIDGITAADLEGLARELFVGDKLRLAVVGPVPTDEPLAELLRL